MVLTLDGKLEIVAHVKSVVGNLNYSRHLFIARAVANSKLI